ncbi:MAG TPA: hypothetical protein VNL92_02895 [Dehalococcoidia bacterium]|nr:hypothetical protein [Dehalococcoidia bacterium]
MRTRTIADALYAPAASATPRRLGVLFSDTRVSWLWLVARVYLGWQWLDAGRHKLEDESWMETGVALRGFWERAVAIPEGGQPAITYGWYRDFLQYMLDHEWYEWFAPLIAIGETALGVALHPGGVYGHRCRDRRLHELQLHARWFREYESSALRARRPAVARVADGRLPRPRPVAAAVPRHALAAGTHFGDAAQGRGVGGTMLRPALITLHALNSALAVAAGQATVRDRTVIIRWWHWSQGPWWAMFAFVTVLAARLAQDDLRERRASWP